MDDDLRSSPQLPAAMVRKVREALLWAGRGLVAAVVSFAGGVALLIAFVLAVALLPLGIGVFLVPLVAAAVRGLLNEERRLAETWFGVRIPVPYRLPSRTAKPNSGLRPPSDVPRGLAGSWHRCRAVLTDVATWRDLLWMALAPVALSLGILPAALLCHGAEGIVLVPVLTPLVHDYGYGIGWFVEGPAWLMVPLSVVQGVLMIALGVSGGSHILRLRARFAYRLLAPTDAALLAIRVRDLAVSRSEVVTAEAAELRRIERDLHDGAQARLVALGMNLGMAEDLLASDPDTAHRLLVEAREAGNQALAELRDLVRGIHPPVLAERGLCDALTALALALPIPVTTHMELTHRLAAPIETAAYFAGAEALANVVKHAHATSAWLHVRYTDRMLTLVVGDDGRGGADPAGGSGLRGVERRLRAHDGTLAVTSPPGGPTVVTMGVPCALSSLRTSPSSVTD
ncbi:sensor histidine kinase [Streptomyces sp. NPDC048434]|uniref:sensor histidine kinase n=1 Tax=Streptomyces sp. NPDC048434 TaxID=3365549 RepID=UPI003712059C